MTSFTREMLLAAYPKAKDSSFIQLQNKEIINIENLGDCKAIRKLDVSMNALKSLNGISGLSSLTWLKAVANALQDEGMDDIKYLTSLVTLNLGKNEISVMSSDVLNPLQALKALVLNDNVIEEGEEHYCSPIICLK